MTATIGHIPNRHRAMIERAYATGHARVSSSPGGWERRFAGMLELLAYCAADHCHAAAEAREGRPCRDPEELVQLRIAVRDLMVRFLLLPAEHVALGTIRPDGLDADIAALCGVPEPGTA